MKLTVLVIAGFLPLCGVAQVIELTDHTRPRAKVQTFHVKCANGRLGFIRLDQTKVPLSVCASVQDGSHIEKCTIVASKTASQAVRSIAESVCQ